MKNKIGKSMALLLACTLLYTGCGQSVIGEKQAFNPNITVGDSETQPVQERIFTLKLPCNFSGQGDPWRVADEETHRATTLLFDALVRLTPSYQAEKALAKEILAQDARSYLITVRDDIRFSDGTPLTAQIVDSSLGLAMTAGSYYQFSLANIATHRALDANQLEITLREADPEFLNLLTFPIAKLSGSRYIGTGRYQYRTQEANQIVLERNPTYWGETSSIPEIYLVELPRQEIASYSLKIGNVDCIYAGMDSDAALSLSSSNYPVNCNNIVFLGVNGQKGPMTDPTLRRAVSLGVDRDYLSRAVYSSMAKAAYTPFHPDYYRIQSLTPGKRQLEEAKTLVADSKKQNEAGVIPLTLVYNAENSAHTQLAKQVVVDLQEAGIEAVPVGKPFREYLTVLGNGGYDLYVGELEIPNNMDLSHLMTRGEKYGYGTAPYPTLSQSWAALKTDSGEAAYQNFLTQYDQYLPAIPLVYRQGMFSFARKLSLKVEAIPSDLFDNIDRWQ